MAESAEASGTTPAAPAQPDMQHELEIPTVVEAPARTQAIVQLPVIPKPVTTITTSISYSSSDFHE